MLQYLVRDQVVYRCFTQEISYEIKTLEGEGVVRKKHIEKTAKRFNDPALIKRTY